MNFPFWLCTHCDLAIAEMQFPITAATRVPVCPKCLGWQTVDVAIGDEETELDLNMVVGVTEEGGK